MISLEGVMAAAWEVETFCKSLGWRFCFIGGVAVQRWGRSRLTNDVDLTLITEFGKEMSVIDSLVKQFSPRMKNVAEFAVANRVVLLRTLTGVNVDIALGGLPFEEDAIHRATPWKLSEAIALTTCSAEDLIVLKGFAGRHRDWSDIEGVLTAQRGKLDVASIRRNLAGLLELKESGGDMEKFDQIAAAVNEKLSP